MGVTSSYSEKATIRCSDGEVLFGGIKTHGANVVISWIGEFFHLTSSNHTRPHVEVFPDGVLVGCTFVTAAAIKAIAREFDDFVVSRSRVIQP